MKRCPRCLRTLGASEFYPSQWMRVGTPCKECQATYDRERYRRRRGGLAEMIADGVLRRLGL